MKFNFENFITSLLLCVYANALAMSSSINQTAEDLGISAENYTMWSANHNMSELYYNGYYINTVDGLVQYYEDALDITNSIISTYVGNIFNIEDASDSDEIMVFTSLNEARSYYLSFELGSPQTDADTSTTTYLEKRMCHDKRSKCGQFCSIGHFCTDIHCQKCYAVAINNCLWQKRCKR